ncbi:tRNA threonylcarbamoyladenosine dehydratase [bacterium]|jgi:tRNA A37 threonylcarbamoyladenosine dehydratase|nr:tRNA threonylcarbamoyladenosine dehydratase [bacterium]
MSDGTHDYEARFGGLGRLLGRTALDRLGGAHACVIGVGGVGSWTAEALARSGVGAITLIDLDEVCVSNVNRQLHALDGQIGRPKVLVLAERIRAIHPACRVNAVQEFFTASNADALLSPALSYSVVVDAIDAVAHKSRLLAACSVRALPCVTTGGAGGKRDGTRLRVGDLGESGGDDLLRQVRKILRREHGFPGGEGHRYGVRAVWSTEPPVYPWADGTCAASPEPGSATRLDCAAGLGAAVWVTATFGFAAAQEAVRLITSPDQKTG